MAVKSKVGSCDLNRTELIYTSLGKISDRLGSCGQAVFVVDQNVARIYQDLIRKLTGECPAYIFDASESVKNLDQVRNLVNFLTASQVTRQHTLVAIGGGITTDLAGFTAAIYKRGTGLCLIPTTFLAMIDAAVGGKTGVNHAGFKNFLGTFYPADSVIIAPEFLISLPQQEIANGWAECIKVALIGDGNLLKLIESNRDRQITSEILREAIRIKLDICKSDLRDRGIRRLLNLGHTFAHLLESATENQIRHGAAVSVGICLAAAVSMDLGYINEKDITGIKTLLSSYGLPTEIKSDLKAEIIEKAPGILCHDKKNTGRNNLNLVLFRQKGQVFRAEPVELDYIVNVLQKFI